MNRIAIAAATIFVMNTKYALAVPEEAMEVQRCVWRCLADSPGPESKIYRDCTVKNCGFTKKSRKRR